MKTFAAFTVGLVLVLSVAPICGAPVSNEPQVRPIIEVKFTLHDDYAVLVPGKVGNGRNGRPIQIMIDTGSDETLLDTSLMKRLKLKPQGDVPIVLPYKTMTGKRVTIDHFEIGPLGFGNQSVLAANLSEFSAAGQHTTIDLIVGYNVLCSLDSFQIDYTAKLLSLAPGVPGERNRACENRSLPILNAVITGRDSPVRLLLDTGSKGLVLFGQQHEYRASNIDDTRGIRPLTLSGLTRTLVELPSLDFGGGTVMKNPRGYLVGPRPPSLSWVDGFIGGGGDAGLSFLRIDTREQCVRLKFRGIQ